MSNPRFRPVDWIVDPESFGRIEKALWVKPSGGRETRELFASKMQHLWAIRIRRRLREKGLKLTTYAVRAGTGYDRLTKVLRGVVIMRIEDLADAERVLGGIVIGVNLQTVPQLELDD